MRAGNDRPVGEHGRADAGADGEQDRVRHSARRSGTGFGEQRNLRVIAEADAEVGKNRLEIEPIEIAQVRDPTTGGVLDEAGHGDADPIDAARLILQCTQPSDELIAARRRRFLGHGSQGRDVAGENGGAQIGTAEIDGQHAGHRRTDPMRRSS
jgi:hypothetical protein